MTARARCANSTHVRPPKHCVARSVPGITRRVRPLRVKYQKAKGFLQGTSHAETLPQLSIVAVVERIGLRYTEQNLDWPKDGCGVRHTSLHFGIPIVEYLMEADSARPLKSAQACASLSCVRARSARACEDPMDHRMFERKHSDCCEEALCALVGSLCACAERLCKRS